MNLKFFCLETSTFVYYKIFPVFQIFPNIEPAGNVYDLFLENFPNIPFYIPKYLLTTYIYIFFLLSSFSLNEHINVGDTFFFINIMYYIVLYCIVYCIKSFTDDMAIHSEGELSHPDSLTVSSIQAARIQAACMGVYKKTTRTLSGRPVWQSSVRPDRYLFYHGKTIYLEKV